MDNDLFKDLVAGAKEILAIERGQKKPKNVTVVKVFDVKKIRDNTMLSQKKFADAIGISVRTLQDWEQKRREPSGPARRLLEVAARYPETLVKCYSETVKEELAFT